MDATPILTALVTGVTGVLSGFLGYWAARNQNQVDLAKIGIERDRLGLELEEPQRQLRRTAYHDFLDSAYRIHLHLAGIQPLPDDERAAALRELGHRANGVYLTGSEDAKEAATALQAVVRSALEQDDYVESGARERVQDAVRDAIEAMRADAAPKQ